MLNVAPEYAEALHVLRQERMKLQVVHSTVSFRLAEPADWEYASREDAAEIPLINVAPECTDMLRVQGQKLISLAADSRLNGLQTIDQLTHQAGDLAEDAQRALELTGIFARLFNHDYVGTDHLLLGLRKVDLGGAGQILKNCLLPAKLAEIEVQALTLPAAESPRHLPVTPQLNKVIQNAWEEARARNHPVLGTAHILLGLLRQEEGIGTQILDTFGLDTEDLRKQALKYLLDMDVAFFSAREMGPKSLPPDAMTEKLPPT